MKSCENCKFSDMDYIWDEETGEEYPLITCQKGNDVSCDFECKDFKEYKPKPYKEEDTECDKCEYLSQCKNAGNCIDCTTGLDTRSHYIIGRGVKCEKHNNITAL